ncbi:hypothetical protein GBF38_008726 [Nibea albiflora]|uniref:Uncharacterized protein n=1 Tax=Nibea albiflora TaxID=240163 RepID=A0ACB7ERQ4_NIBAL|nr:hypothetical protein GBF38_008726 [Nibea albiflora]
MSDTFSGAVQAVRVSPLGDDPETSGTHKFIVQTKTAAACFTSAVTQNSPLGIVLSPTPPQTHLPPRLSITTTRPSLIHHPDTRRSTFDCTGCPLLTVCR